MTYHLSDFYSVKMKKKGELASITSATTNFPDPWETISKEWIAASGSEVPNLMHDMNDRVNRFQASAQRFSQVVCTANNVDNTEYCMSSFLNHAKEIADLSSKIHDLHHNCRALTNSPEKDMETISLVRNWQELLSLSVKKLHNTGNSKFDEIAKSNLTELKRQRKLQKTSDVETNQKRGKQIRKANYAVDTKKILLDIENHIEKARHFGVGIILLIQDREHECCKRAI